MPQKISRDAIPQIMSEYIDKAMVPHAPDQWTLAALGGAKVFAPRLINGYLDKVAPVLILDGTLDNQGMINLDHALEVGLSSMATVKELHIGPMTFDANDVRAIIQIARAMPQCVTVPDASASAPTQITTVEEE